MHFIDFVLRNLLRRKVRTALTVVGVSVAIAAVVALVSVTDGYRRSIKDKYAAHGVDLIVARAGVTKRETSTLDEKLLKRLEELDGVDKVSMALYHAAPFAKGSLRKWPINGWPVDSFAFDALTITSGRKIEPSDQSAVLLGRTLADELNKHVGDEVHIDDSAFKVVGIYESSNVMENRSGVVSLRNLQEIMGRDGYVSEFDIAVRKDLPDRKAALLALRERIENLTGDNRIKLGLQAKETSDFVES